LTVGCRLNPIGSSTFRFHVRIDARKETAKPKSGRPKSFVFAFKPPTKAFNLRLQFTKSRVEKDEIISALETIIRELRAR